MLKAHAAISVACFPIKTEFVRTPEFVLAAKKTANNKQSESCNYTKNVMQNKILNSNRNCMEFDMVWALGRRPKHRHNSTASPNPNYIT